MWLIDWLEIFFSCQGKEIYDLVTHLELTGNVDNKEKS